MEGKLSKRCSRSGSGSAGKDFQQRLLLSDSADDARRLYVKKSLAVRTDSEKRGELKRAGNTTGAEEGSALVGQKDLACLKGGKPGAVIRAEARESTNTTDGRGTRLEGTGFLLKRCPDKDLRSGIPRRTTLC
ncbi:hypothetical protein D479_09000 [Halobacillus sp. BAB-2008]|nr:hypothetical protein D479_09000 [Halobacillus sp. BAB-2008]